MNNYRTLPIESLGKITVSSFSPLSILAYTSKSKPVLQDEPTEHINTLIPSWVQKMNETGRQGEIIAFNYLKTIYGCVTWVAKDFGDREGYDIAADGYSFEIKSTRSNGNTFYISLHELLTAQNKANDHYLLFIKNVASKPKGYKINNIFDKFSLSWDNLSRLLPANNIEISPTSFKITFDESFLSSQEEIDLSGFSKDESIATY